MPRWEVRRLWASKTGARGIGVTKYQWDLDHLQQHPSNKETTKTVLKNIYLQGAGVM